MFGKIISHKSVKISRYISESVPLARKYHEVESLIGFDECISNPQGISGVEIVVNTPGYQKKIPLV